MTFSHVGTGDHGLTLHDPHNVLRDIDARAWVKHWFHGGGCGMPKSRCARSEVDFLFPRCYDRIKCKRDLSTLMRHFYEQPLSKNWSVGCRLALPVIPHIFLELFEYWLRYCNFELFYVVIPVEYSLPGITSNYSPFHCHIY